MSLSQLMNRHENIVPDGTRVRVVASHMFAIGVGMEGVVTSHADSHGWHGYFVKFPSEQYDVFLCRRDFEVIESESKLAETTKP